MNHVIFPIVAIAAVTAVASPATAQDAGTAGLRVGVLSGIDIMRPGSTVDSGVPGDDQSTDGLLYGLEVGYDLPLGAVVLGVEGEWSGSNAKTKADRRDPNLFGFGEVSTGRDLYVGGRLGVAATPATLVYLKGGYTNTSLNVTAANGTLQTDEKFRLDGWRLGGGVQQSLGLHSYVKLEYRYSNYDDASFEFANGLTTNRFGVDTDRHQVVAGVGMRF